MGFHDAGLGCGDVRQIEIVGDVDECQHLIYWGPLKKPVEWTLKTILAPWSYIASVVYHDMYWYPKNYGRVEEILNSDWGRLFANWEQLQETNR